MTFKVIFWDFDGVIIESDHVRVEGFKEVLRNFSSDKIGQLLDFHARNGGLSRYVKFRYFYENILNRKVSGEEVNRLASEFSAIMRNKLASQHVIIQDSLRFIQKNHKKGIVQFIVSGSDREELRYLCSELGIASYFKEIQGSPTPKNQLVKDLLTRYDIELASVVLIGDSMNDYEAARVNGISFMGYNNTKLEKHGEGYIRLFESL